MNSLVKLVALSLIPGIGGVTLNNLLARFGDIDAVLEADTDQLLAVKGVGKRTAAAIRAADPAQTASDLQRWREAGITLLTWSNLLYPEILVELSDAPPVLFCKGTLDDRQRTGVGYRSGGPQRCARDRSHGCDTGIGGAAATAEEACHRPPDPRQRRAS